LSIEWNICMTDEERACSFSLTCRMTSLICAEAEKEPILRTPD
jgi:hypothetical protein